MSIPDRPTPAEMEDASRWRLTALRERMLLGDWYSDLTEELGQFLAPEVLARMTHPDVTRNALKSFSEQSNVLYSSAPMTSAGAADLAPITPTELWPLRQRGNLLTIGLRDSYMRCDWYTGTGIAYRVVSPSYVCAWATPEVPTQPVVVKELRLRTATGEKEARWVWETWDTRDPLAPVFTIEREDVDRASGKRGLVDVTALYYDVSKGYPYVRSGLGVMPYVAYHPEITDQLWHWNERRELVDGTLKVGCLWTMWLHGCRDCAHPQRVGTDLDAPSAVTTDGLRPVDKIALDQSSILMLRSIAGRNGSVTTLAPGMDPKTQAEAILAYEAGLAQQAGMSAADVQVGGTSGMSGWAITVSRDGQRRVWAAQEPAARMSDRLLLATAAKISNAYGGTSLPEAAADYSITYAPVGRTGEEIKAEIAEVESLESAGYIGPIDAVRRIHPELDYMGAVAKLTDIAKQKIIVAGIAKAAMPVDPPPAVDPPLGV